MEQFLGRELTSKEVVHHIDEDSRNNVIENLLICDRAEHKEIHRRNRSLLATGKSWHIQCSYCQDWKLPSEMSYPDKPYGGCMKCHSKISNEGRARRQTNAIYKQIQPTA